MQIIPTFRYVALIEGTTYLLLAVTMPLKYMADMPLPNYVVGMAHGLFFILYMGILMSCWLRFKWTFSRVFWLGVASLVPFGTFLADARILKPLVKSTV